MDPANLIFRLWAKTNERRGDEEEAWSFHPLPCHLADVGHVAETWLAANQNLKGKFCDLWEAPGSEDVVCTLVLASALHDFGKGCPRFQAKSTIGWQHGYGSFWEYRPIPNGVGFDHGLATYRLFNDVLSPRGRTPVSQSWRMIVPLLRMAGGHHGKLYEPEDLTDPKQACRPNPGSIEHKCLGALLDAIQRLFGPLPDIKSQPEPSFLMLASGFVSIVDWLGSDENFFCFRPDIQSEDELGSYLSSLRTRRVGEQALEAAGVLPMLNRETKSFVQLFGPEPYEGFQASALNSAFGTVPGSEICLIEAPMGLGKTEVALALAVNSIAAEQADGIYFALPTQASANAMFARIYKYTKSIASEKLSLVLAHGARKYYADFRKLLDYSRPAFASDRIGITDDIFPTAEVISAQWLQPSKRALLAPVGLGTVDQAMLGAMGVRHAFVRLFGLARKVIVLDEIHAYDVYMGTILFRLLAWLQALDAKVILLSATLPSLLRARLFRAFGEETVEVSSNSYPQLISCSSRGDIEIVSGDVPDRLKKELSVRHIESDDTTRAGVSWIQKTIRANGCVAWIRNTVKEAQQAYRMLRDAGVSDVELVHARFIRTDRNTKEERLIDGLGKQPEHSARPKRLVVVATQVIEQSVDMDFDAMLSDLAPVDLLLQRAGRLWRHPDRLKHERGTHTEPVLSVLMPDRDNIHALTFGSSAYVYDHEILARSAYIVRRHSTWTLPRACRELVTELYDRDEAYWTSSRLNVDPERLAEIRARRAHVEETQKTLAKRILISSPDREPRMRDASRDGDSDSSIALSTRLVGRSASVVLCKLSPQGVLALGQPNRVLKLPAEGDFRARFSMEEAITLSTVSFPWHSYKGEQYDYVDSELQPIMEWWRTRHPYDDRVFLLLDDSGRGHFGDAEVSYSTEEGLVIQRKRKAGEEEDSFSNL